MSHGYTHCGDCICVVGARCWVCSVLLCGLGASCSLGSLNDLDVWVRVGTCRRLDLACYSTLTSAVSSVCRVSTYLLCLLVGWLLWKTLQ